ncbi:PQQ-binding-like beta-propeller repeat protein [Bacteroides sp.]|uniref:outer membrane protein assembly factor BamB family protein n=1 Tax=Bacteroides sp. TaxID=29523 RepID=UPI00260759FC|nr:PQQ-binding-like beta-propeller repeat protein [Bacteroides sp.]
MKKILYSLLFIFTVVFTACEEDLPKASFDLYELKSLTATAGDMNVTLSWEAYENARPNEYLILWTSGSSEAEGGEMTVDAKTMTATINNLVNDVAYTFSVQPRYAGGLASKTTAACTPKNARYPISDLTAAAGNERVRLRWTKPASERFTRYQVSVNPGNQIINLDDTSLEEYIVDGLTNDQEYTFNVVCVYPTGNSIAVETSATPGLIYPILASTELVVWEPSTFAYNDMYFMAGEVKSVSWDFGDGTIYQCVRNAAINNVYAINPNGTQKWAVKLDAAIGAFPALSVDGILYCLTNKSTLYALDASSGAIKWQQSLDGATGSAVAIDKAGNVYAGTSAAIYAFKPNKDQIWKLEEVNVTEQATFALKEQVLYATLKGGGLVAVDMTNGTKKWTYPTTKGDAYFPIADKNGNVYFTEKGSQTVHAVNAAGSKIWEKNVGNNLNYSGGALSTDGILYVGTQSNNKVLGLDITNGNIVFEETVGQQVMAAVTIGPDKRLYCGTIGSNNIGSVKAFAVNKTLATDSWSIRGGDIQGTNRQK